MPSDTAIVAVGIDDTRQLVILAMSDRVAEAHAEDAFVIEAFFEETCPRTPGVWLWEGSYEDSDADGEWLRPTAEEIERMHAQQEEAA
jgi:hypothetical protein